MTLQWTVARETMAAWLGDGMQLSTSCTGMPRWRSCLVSRAVMTGMKSAVREMIEAIKIR